MRSASFFGRFYFFVLKNALGKSHVQQWKVEDKLVA